MANTNVFSKWRLDLASGESRVTSKSTGDQSVNPPGYIANINVQAASDEEHTQQQQQKHLLTKRAWDMALAPAKSLPMNMFMMYMAGNTISIFPIMMVAMMVWRPIKALTAVNTTFKPLEEDNIGSLLLHKLVFILGNLGAIALAVYKINGMGLLPNTDSDFLDFLPEPERVHYALSADILN
ncbi:hypothetical protein QR680_016093 [Steinernema hermaphroditum]|uniref:ER membrane protein complex subunit 4 n=1 Tax=Steinernema hermaphroditum TaxID=289476 RepID=A0AA39HB34_9BILA|nr:hypothetical protein QR680_016093 [Steinernema hermaphroditum]